MTILGLHSVAELREWLAAMDYEQAQIASAHDAFAATWAVQDAAAATAWAGDWKTLRARYGEARAKAQGAIAHAAHDPRPDNLIPVEDEWVAIERALARNPGTMSRGDLQDLYGRLAAAQGKPMDFSRMPQPTASADADVAVLKAADAAIRAGESAMRRITPSKSTGTLVLVCLGSGLSLATLIAFRSVFK
jgi:hypothetical protein